MNLPPQFSIKPIKCSRDGCEVYFQPTHPSRKYCTVKCKQKQERINVKLRDRRERASAEVGLNPGMQEVPNPTVEVLNTCQELLLSKAVEHFCFTGEFPTWTPKEGIVVDKLEDELNRHMVYFDPMAWAIKNGKLQF